MLLTKHKLLLLGIGWFVLAMLVLGGMAAYAVSDVPLPPVPATVVVLAYVAAPTAIPPQLASHLAASGDVDPATATPTASLVVKTDTPSTTPSPTETSTKTPPPTRTRAPTAAATSTEPPTLPPDTATATVPPATSTPVTPPATPTATIE